MRTVIVGIAPARPGEEGQPLSAVAPRSTGRKIAGMIGVGKYEYMKAFDRINLCPFPQESTIPVEEWRVAASNLGASLLRGRRVILLGVNVAQCFGIDVTSPPNQFLKWTDSPETKIPNYGLVGWNAGDRKPPFAWAILPHPSGRNRWYNNQVNKEAAIGFLKREWERMRGVL